MSEFPIGIVATSQKAGKEYAETLRLENYVIFTQPSKAEGAHLRGVIVTPGYLSWTLEYFMRSLHIFETAHRSAAVTGAPNG